MAVITVIIITRGVIMVVMAVVAAAVVITPGKGSGKNPEKSSLRRKRVLTVGLSAAVAFTTKSLLYFVRRLDRCCPQLNLIALCFV